MHPETARELGIDDGEWVYAENDRGRVRCKAKVTPIAHPRIVIGGSRLVAAGDRRQGTRASTVSGTINCNQLVPMGTQSRSGYGGAAYKTILCRIAKIKTGGQ